MVLASCRSKGTVKWFNGTKGFGFVWPDDGGDDLFVHRYSIEDQVYRTFAESVRGLRGRRWTHQGRRRHRTWRI
ncbi:hypothetical protein B296_00045717 [Ensete ventricosum]|uniref:CSD domain-containing protein n=1 Tax=Ensete ventricosum TaxID=4639 RepID=A0A426Z6G0_ENSVE|nr:hypothetical protein B296_00045717 [Ensete ventricosum]